MGRQDPAKTALLVNTDKSAPPKTSMYAFYVLAVLTVTSVAEKTADMGRLSAILASFWLFLASFWRFWTV
jgi:hypothetical protein